jgi:hypothetical protein
MVKFANIIFKGLTREDIFCEDNKLKVIIPTNAELIVKAQSYNKLKTIISDNFATFDGQIPYFFVNWWFYLLLLSFTNKIKLINFFVVSMLIFQSSVAGHVVFAGLSAVYILVFINFLRKEDELLFK